MNFINSTVNTYRRKNSLKQVKKHIRKILKKCLILNQFKTTSKKKSIFKKINTKILKKNLNKFCANKNTINPHNVFNILKKTKTKCFNINVYKKLNLKKIWKKKNAILQ